MTGKIHLTNMAFFGHHGDVPAETELGQRFYVDLALTLDIAAVARSDALADTVDYVAVHALCRELMEGTPVKLIETLAARIMEAVLKKFPRVAKVGITLRKPSVPLRGVLDHVAIEASLSRG